MALPKRRFAGRVKRGNHISARKKECVESGEPHQGFCESKANEPEGGKKLVDATNA